MSLRSDVEVLRDETVVALAAAHDHFVYTKKIWRIVDVEVRRPHDAVALLGEPQGLIEGQPILRHPERRGEGENANGDTAPEPGRESMQGHVAVNDTAQPLVALGLVSLRAILTARDGGLVPGRKGHSALRIEH